MFDYTNTDVVWMVMIFGICGYSGIVIRMCKESTNLKRQKIVNKHWDKILPLFLPIFYYFGEETPLICCLQPLNYLYINANGELPVIRFRKFWLFIYLKSYVLNAIHLPSVLWKYSICPYISPRLNAFF